MSKTVLVTGASIGFGAMTARYIRRDSRPTDGAQQGASAALPSR